MTYQQAGIMALTKRIIGWGVFLLSIMSTIVSIVLFLASQGKKQTEGIGAVIGDFMTMIVDMVRYNTSFLNMFWHNSPVPQLGTGLSSPNVLFLLIYFLIFVGVALNLSGARMQRQMKYVRERIEDQLVLEKAKGELAQTRKQLEQGVSYTGHTMFKQYVALYISPIVVGVVGYFILKFLSLQ